LNNLVKVYIGDLKINEDSHTFIWNYDRSLVVGESFFDTKVIFLDIDVLDLDKKEIEWIVKNSKVKTVLSTLYPDKIDKKLDCEIVYKDNWIPSKDLQVWDLLKILYNEKDRMKVRRILVENNMSLYLLNNWIQGNPSKDNMGALRVLDHYLTKSPPGLWISLVSFLLLDGPRYTHYRFKKS